MGSKCKSHSIGWFMCAGFVVVVVVVVVVVDKLKKIQVKSEYCVVSQGSLRAVSRLLYN